MDLTQLNKKILSIEEDITTLVKEEKKFFKLKKFYVKIRFLIGKNEIVSFKVSKKYFSKKTHKKLKFTNKHHSWLLDKLYYDCLINWEDILKIDVAYIDIIVKNKDKKLFNYAIII